MNNDLGLFHISKIITTSGIVSLIEVINTQTQDGYVSHQARIGRHLWLLRVTCSLRNDAEFVRML